MDDQYVDVYIDLRPQAYTYMQNGSLAEEVKLTGAPSGGRSSRGTCAHASPQEVFAYARVLEVHWPMVFCDDCLEILEGRKPFAVPDAPESSGALNFEAIIAPEVGQGLASRGKASNEATASRYRVAEDLAPLSRS